MTSKAPKDTLDKFFANPSRYAGSIKKMIESDESDLTREHVRERLTKLLVKADVFYILEQDKIEIEKARTTYQNEIGVKKILRENTSATMLELQHKLVEYCEEKGLEFLPKLGSFPELVNEGKSDWIYLTIDNEEWAIEVGFDFVRCLHKLDDSWAPHNKIFSRLIRFSDLERKFE